MADWEIKEVVPDDLPQVLNLLREFAEFEKLLQEFILTEEKLHQGLFGETKSAECLVVWKEQKIVGLAIFYFVFRTFRGEKSLYLEDLYISPKTRGQGLGEHLLKTVARFGKERGCSRMDWQTSKWNTSAVRFYQNLGAELTDEHLDFRLIADNFIKLSK